MKKVAVLLVAFGVAWLLTQNAAFAQDAMAAFESPPDGSIVTGVRPIQGWAVGPIESIAIFFGDFLFGNAACCTPRGDVAAALDDERALMSGWTMTMNWGLFGSGPVNVTVEVTYKNGDKLAFFHRITVVSPANREFISVVDFSTATADVVGDSIMIEGLFAPPFGRFPGTEFGVELKWDPAVQAFGVVATK